MHVEHDDQRLLGASRFERLLSARRLDRPVARLFYDGGGHSPEPRVVVDDQDRSALLFHAATSDPGRDLTVLADPRPPRKGPARMCRRPFIWGRLRRSSDEIVPIGERDRLCAAAHAELSQDVLDVRPDGLATY